VDLFQTKQVAPGGKLYLKDPKVIKFWTDWELVRRDNSRKIQELKISDTKLAQQMATLKAQHEAVECERMTVQAQMEQIRAELWLSITETEPAFDMAHEWALVREESNADTLCIMRDIDQNDLMRKALLDALKGESNERKVGFGR
jgi:hypothetical protein